MTLPRDVQPGRFYLVTRRCTQRQFLLRPDAETNNNFLYCLAVAAERSDVEILLPCAMSNHYHAVVYDRHGNLPVFTEHFHKLLAKSQNALRGRWENMWASEQVCVVRLERFEDVLAKLVYVATNPVKDGLVAKVHQWPGFHGLAALLADRPMTARRPTHYFRTDGPMSESATLRLTLPRELGDADQVRAELRARVAEVEKSLEENRQRDRRRVLGRRAVLHQSWRDSPTTRAPRRNLRPRVAARNVWARVEALLRIRAFLEAYREARARWLAGLTAAFPPGTYWLRRFAHVPIAA
jgi:putative transposase